MIKYDFYLIHHNMLSLFSFFQNFEQILEEEKSTSSNIMGNKSRGGKKAATKSKVQKVNSDSDDDDYAPKQKAGEYRSI